MANKKDISITLSLSPDFNGVKKFESALEQSMSRVSNAGKQAGKAVDAAMKGLGVKSSSAIKAEIDSIRARFDLVRNSGVASGRDIELAWQRSQQKISGLRTELAGTGTAFAQTTGKLRTGMDSISKTMLVWQRALGAIFAVRGASGLVAANLRIADSYTMLEGRLKLVTDSGEELERVQKRLFAIAQGSRATYEGTAKVFSRFAQAVKGQGVSSDELLTITEALNKAFVISGATTTEAENAMIQLSQGFSSGVLRGDEFRSVMEQGGRVVDMLTDHLKVNRGELRKMAEDGKITAQVMRDAFAAGIAKVNEEFDQLPVTVGQAMTQLRNEWGKMVSEWNKAEGVTSELASSIQFLAKNLEAVLSAVAHLTIALVGIGVGFSIDAILIRLAALRVSLNATTAAASRLQKTFLLFASFNAGWQFGTWLRKEFAVVEKAGIAMAAGLHKAWVVISEGAIFGDNTAMRQELAKVDTIYAEMFSEVDKRGAESASNQKKSEKGITENTKKEAAKQKAAKTAALTAIQAEYKKHFTKLKEIQGGIDSLAKEINTNKLDFAQEEFDLEVKLHGDKAGEQMLMGRIADLKRLAGEAGKAGVAGWKEQVSLLERAKGLALSMNADVEKVSKADVVAAKEKLRLAERAVQAHNVSSKRSAYKEALADYQKLVKEQQNGPSEEKKQEAVREKLEEVRSINNEILAVKEAQITALQKQADIKFENMDALIAEAGFEAFGEGLDEAQKKWLVNWIKMRQAANKQIDAVEEKLQNIKDKTITVTIVEKIAKAAGGVVAAAKKAYAVGGKVTGPGGIDKVSAWLTAGEVVIKEPSVQAAGMRAALAFNAGNWGVVVEELQKRMAGRFQHGGLAGGLPAPNIPRLAFATGGAVTAPETAMASMGVVKMDLGIIPGRPRITAFAKREEARELGRQLHDLVQGASS